MKNEEGRMGENELKEAKKKTCLDCLHCKVSAKSMVSMRLCYCDKEGKEVQPQEPYWSEKNVCGEFKSMRERIIKPHKIPRKPLLKEADFMSGVSWR
jgi:hypothetical protein